MWKGVMGVEVGVDTGRALPLVRAVVEVLADVALSVTDDEVEEEEAAPSAADVEQSAGGAAAAALGAALEGRRGRA